MQIASFHGMQLPSASHVFEAGGDIMSHSNTKLCSLAPWIRAARMCFLCLCHLSLLKFKGNCATRQPMWCPLSSLCMGNPMFSLTACSPVLSCGSKNVFLISSSTWEDIKMKPLTFTHCGYVHIFNFSAQILRCTYSRLQSVFYAKLMLYAQLHHSISCVGEKRKSHSSERWIIPVLTHWNTRWRSWEQQDTRQI